MKIVTNVNRLDSCGGVEMTVLQATRELVSRGHEVHLVYARGGDLVAEFSSLCASLHKVPTCDYGFPQSRMRALVDGVRLVPAVVSAARCRPDVYLMNKARSAAWALQAAKLSPAPVVCQWHGPNAPGRQRVASLSASVSRFTANSGFTRDAWLNAGIDPAKVDLVYLGIDPAEYPQGGATERYAARERLGIRQDDFVATFVGRLDASKGVPVLLDAWHRLGLTSSEAQLLLVGTPVLQGDPQAYLDELTASAPPGSVRFLGARRDVVTPLHAADVAVVPSVVHESFGRTVIEALATGRPVVASRAGAMPEILAGPFDRFLFERGDAAALATLLSGLVGWQAREPELADRCASRVHTAFTLTAMVDGIETAIERAVSSSRGRAQ